MNDASVFASFYLKLCNFFGNFSFNYANFLNFLENYRVKFLQNFGLGMRRIFQKMYTPMPDI